MIIKNTSITNEQKLADLLSHTDLKNECLEWRGCYNTDGYARMGGNVKVHRLIYSLKHNKDITGLVIRHTCDNIKCINPDHLLDGTPNDNMQDRWNRGGYNRNISKPIIEKVLILLETKVLKQSEIATLVGIGQRRVSDINCGKYCSATGRFLGHG